MNRFNSLFTNAVATIFIWLSVLAVRLISGAEVGVTTFGIVVGIGTTSALWLVWALAGLSSSPQKEPQQKAKRSASDDARLSLLLELMGEDERKTLRQRIVSDLGSDGELYSLVDLLDAQNDRSRRRQ